MAPKPRPLKGPFSTKDPSTAMKTVSKSTLMPPPPDPPIARAILEPEINGLSTCLKNAAVKTGQIYGFYADTRRLGIQKHAPKPPRSLTASLGREIEKYDQLVDSMEAHLFRAITVLQRDLVREEQRIKDAAEASVATRTRSKSASLSPTSTRIPLPPAPDVTMVDASQPTQNAPVPTPTNSPPAPGPGRRPSAISISSLHRPAFPLKLDLSSTALRITAEEASMFSSGLASPVTLAPKSARAIGPNEIPPDLMAAFASTSSLDRPVDIDLTIPDTDHTNPTDGKISNVGSTADKPIELDLDAMDITMTDLFGDTSDTGSNDANGAMDGLFSPVVAEPTTNSDNGVAGSNKMDAPFLDALGQSNNDNDIFASLGVQEPQQLKNDASASHSTSSTLLANFDPASQLQSENSHNMDVPEAPFDLGSLDISTLSPSLFGNAAYSDMNFSIDMDQFLEMGPASDKKDDGEGDTLEPT